MNRRAFAIGGLALGAGTSLSTHPSAAGAQEATPIPNNFEGQLLRATRTYQAAEIQPGAPLIFQFTVFEFDSENNAKPAVSQIAKGIQNQNALHLSDLAAKGAPNIGDDRVAFEAKLELRGTLLDAAFLIFREGTAVHLWFAAGLGASPLDDLITIAEGDFGAVEATPQATAEVSEDMILGLLPDVDDLPEGYDLEEERVQSPDDVATPVS